eukprot:2596855-Rhodomonas_salina.1
MPSVNFQGNFRHPFTRRSPGTNQYGRSKTVLKKYLYKRMYHECAPTCSRSHKEETWREACGNSWGTSRACSSGAALLLVWL